METQLYSSYTYVHKSGTCTYMSIHIQILTQTHTNTYAQIYTPTHANAHICPQTLVFKCHLHVDTHRNIGTHMLQVMSGIRLGSTINLKFYESQEGLTPPHLHPTQGPFSGAPVSDL